MAQHIEMRIHVEHWKPSVDKDFFQKKVLIINLPASEEKQKNCRRARLTDDPNVDTVRCYDDPHRTYLRRIIAVFETQEYAEKYVKWTDKTFQGSTIRPAFLLLTLLEAIGMVEKSNVKKAVRAGTYRPTDFYTAVTIKFGDAPFQRGPEYLREFFCKCGSIKSVNFTEDFTSCQMTFAFFSEALAAELYFHEVSYAGVEYSVVLNGEENPFDSIRDMLRVVDEVEPPIECCSAWQDCRNITRRLRCRPCLSDVDSSPDDPVEEPSEPVASAEDVV